MTSIQLTLVAPIDADHPVLTSRIQDDIQTPATETREQIDSAYIMGNNDKCVMQHPLARTTLELLAAPSAASLRPPTQPTPFL